MEDKDKLDKAIEHAIRQVGKERDAEDLATLRRFMYGQDKHKYHSCSSYSIVVDDDCGGFEPKLKPRKNSSKKSFIAIITSIAAVITIVFSFNIYQDNRRMDKLFETYYTPLEYDSQLMSRGEETISPELASAMESYQKGDYAISLQKFEAIPDVEENYLIYKAICLLETEQTEDAITLLELLVANGESTEYYQQACWYLALIYLSNHEKNKVLNIILLNKDLGNNFNLLHNSIR